MSEFLRIVLLGICVGVPLHLGFVWLSNRGYRSLNRDWAEALAEVATTLEIDFVPARWGRPAAEGVVGGCFVKIDTVARDGGDPPITRLRVDAGLPSTLTIKHQGMGNRLSQLVRGKDIQVGLEAFDEAFLLDGIPDAELLSLLSDRCRAAIWKCIGEHKLPADRPGTSCWVEKGQLRLNCVGYMTRTEVLEAVSALLELGEVLREFSSTAAGLLHHAFEDPEPAFRLRCFSALLEHCASTPEAQEALRRGAASEDPGFLFVVERHKPEPNLDVIAALVRGGGLPPSLKTSGLHMLDSRHAGELSVEAEGPEGALALADKTEGALSPAEPARARPKKERQ